MKNFFFSNKIIFAAIVINTMIIFLMDFPSFHGDPTLRLLDQIFIVFFTIEAIVKIKVLGTKGYFKNKWNTFDFLLVIFSLPSLLIIFFDNIPDSSIIMLLRVLRLMRLFRFMRFIPNLNHIFSGVARALKASVFIIAALLFFNFVFAMFACHLYKDIAPEFFGDPLRSAYTTFQLFTIEGWNEIARVTCSRIENPIWAWITRFSFVSVVLAGGIFGLSIANAIFVDEMTIDNNDDIEVKIDELNRKLNILLAEKEQQINTDSNQQDETV